jgi:hypothetical protein
MSQEPTFTLGRVEMAEVVPGTERLRFFAELSNTMSVDVSDPDRPLGELMDELEVLECILIAEAVWRVELGPRSPSVAQAKALVGKFPTLHALVEAAEAAAVVTEPQPSATFQVHVLGEATAGPPRSDLDRYLASLHQRFANSMHASTRVYTCRSWRRDRRAPAPYELHWNADDVPGEELLGEIGWTVPGPLVERIEIELASGEAVRLFLFNSDSDLCFQEMLLPERSGRMEKVARTGLNDDHTVQ